MSDFQKQYDEALKDSGIPKNPALQTVEQQQQAAMIYFVVGLQISLDGLEKS